MLCVVQGLDYTTFMSFSVAISSDEYPKLFLVLVERLTTLQVRPRPIFAHARACRQEGGSKNLSHMDVEVVRLGKKIQNSDILVVHEVPVFH